MSEPTVDPETFREVIGHFMSGVTVISTRVDGVDHGATASAVSSLSLEPPMVLVCLHQKAPTQAAVRAAGTFVVNILDSRSEQLAYQFARPGDDKFDGVPVTTTALGMPVLEEALASLECRVVETLVGGTHRVFLACVVGVRSRDGEPLAYYRGGFGRLELAADAQALAELSELVLRRGFALDVPLGVEEVAQRLGVRPENARYALTRLVGQGLVSREADRGYLPRPLDVRASEDAFTATLAMELGAAELTVGRVSDEDLQRWEERLRAVDRHVADGLAAGSARYVNDLRVLHEQPIRLVGSERLLEAYRGVSTSAYIGAALAVEPVVASGSQEHHARLLDGYRRADLPAVRRALVAHSDSAKAAQRAALDTAGGRL